MRNGTSILTDTKVLMLIFIMGLLIAFIITSCNWKSVTVEDVNEASESMFVCCEVTANWRVYYHKETRVMYIMKSSCWELLVNADGSPMLYGK